MKCMSAVMLLCAAAIASPALAAGTVELKSAVEMEVQVTNEKGEKVTKRVPATKALPGDVLIYIVSYANNGKDAAEKVVITNPVPEHMVYVLGSAAGEGAAAIYSVDGGKTFGPAETLKVQTANGVERAAQAADYTHIRWTLSRTVKPGEKGVVTFQAKLK